MQPETKTIEPPSNGRPHSESPASSSESRLRLAPQRRTWLAAVLIGLVAGTAVVVQRRLAHPAQTARRSAAPTLLQVGAAPARKGNIGIYVNALGAVTPIYTVAVKSRVDGQLVKVNYKEGQKVHEGDLLVEIDSGPYQAQLTQYQGQYARDKALLENAHIDLDRYQAAYAKNAVPRQTLDTQVATVHQYEGAVQLDQGLIDNARVQLAYCHITAPISGRVGLRLIDPGNIVHASDTNPLVVITELQPITVIFSVAEDYLPEIQQQLNQGNRLLVEAFDRAQVKKLATGSLLTLDNQIDPNTGTIKLKALFTNEDNALFPSQFVNARLLVDTARDVTLIETTAIQRNAQGPFVYLVKPDQTVAMQTVSLGPSDGNVTALEGLDAGEVIATNNFNRLQDGMKVTVRNGGDGSRSKRAQAGGVKKTAAAGTLEASAGD